MTKFMRVNGEPDSFFVDLAEIAFVKIGPNGGRIILKSGNAVEFVQPEALQPIADALTAIIQGDIDL